MVAPAGQVFHEGENRLGFGVFTVEREPVADAEVAIYAAPPEQAGDGPYPGLGRVARRRGRVPARGAPHPIPTPPRSVYASDVDFDRKGEWRLLALIREPDGSFTYTAAPSAVVGQFPKVPVVGEKAPVIDTLTGERRRRRSGQDRHPPAAEQRCTTTNFADVVGNEPVVLLFATPALCSSRVCGPVVDIAEEVKAERGDEAAFIMQEIYKDNMVDNGLRDQVKAYNLPSEPWLFVIDTDGKISTAIEGAFSEGELERGARQGELSGRRPGPARLSAAGPAARACPPARDRASRASAVLTRRR